MVVNFWRTPPPHTILNNTVSAYISIEEASTQNVGTAVFPGLKEGQRDRITVAAAVTCSLAGPAERAAPPHSYGDAFFNFVAPDNFSTALFTANNSLPGVSEMSLAEFQDVDLPEHHSYAKDQTAQGTASNIEATRTHTQEISPTSLSAMFVNKPASSLYGNQQLQGLGQLYPGLDSLERLLNGSGNCYNNLSLDKLYNFADCAGLHLILGLNGLQRNPDNSWNTSSTLSLLKYGAGKKYNISWELGNEPNAYRSMVGHAVNSTQLAQDYAKLRTLLQSVRYYNRAHLYGPNAGRPRKNAVLLLDG
ncbi:hypothetical protein CHARACLAT_010055 [Characodon lateralis]|uniref:Uncharacterized protein n=1 Tax=Characodon lateralis TaxID=208331 RepID=A0ABU7ESD3_9TELE|nr:hypothetical protein [Characodon lateralis]